MHVLLAECLGSNHHHHVNQGMWTIHFVREPYIMQEVFTSLGFLGIQTSIHTTYYTHTHTHKTLPTLMLTSASPNDRCNVKQSPLAYETMLNNNQLTP